MASPEAKAAKAAAKAAAAATVQQPELGPVAKARAEGRSTKPA